MTSYEQARTHYERMIYIGYDPRESAAFYTLVHSIATNASGPVEFCPLMTPKLKDYNRPYAQQTNEFTYTRFMVPWLSGYSGISIFMDCDMLCVSDIYELYDLHDPDNAVSVVQHDYTPKTNTKALGSQIKYPRKNWSSVIVFSNDKCRSLTPEYVNNADPMLLHRFKWIEDNQIGELPKEWNHLVGEYDPNPDAKLIHYTLGGPYFNKYTNVEFSDEWNQYHRVMDFTDNSEILESD